MAARLADPAGLVLLVYVDDLAHLIARYILLFELPMASGRVI